MDGKAIVRNERLTEVAGEILDGDLLLFRRDGPIAIAGRGRHVHAAKAAWWEGDLFCLEVREWFGGRAVLLDRLVRRQPSRIDVYRANAGDRWPEYDRRGATRYMRRWAGCPYGYTGVLIAAMSHVPLFRWWIRPSVEDDVLSGRPPFCSQACAAADRLGGGVDPVPHLADGFTEPADLARSPFYQYRFTLV